MTLRSLFFLFLFNFSQIMFAKTFHPVELEMKAEIEGYGYKTANLDLLKDLLTDPDLQKRISPQRVKVPDFVGISSQEITDLLLEEGLDLRSEWNEILDKSVGRNLKQVLENALFEKTLPQSFLDSCKVLAQKIQKTFQKMATHSTEMNIESLDKFIKAASHSGWTLAIRSTGKEDTEKLANAGGNRSELNVAPDYSSVLAKIGSVIASYFEEKSLSQRALAGDNTLFDRPLSPVLVQRMLREALGGSSHSQQIPSGCVVYTIEPAAYLQENSLEVNTLQCSFGSNEGVVQSLVPLDTFYVDKKNKIKSIVKNKFKRVIPKQGKESFGLAQISNPDEIRNKPSLDSSSIKAISEIATYIASFYKKPMDIELVYLPEEKTVYIVQARPLIFKPKEEEPSYLAAPETFPESFSFNSIIPGDSCVKIITSQNQILLASTLKEALDEYTRSDKFVKAKLQVVFAEAEVDTTSHEAAVFRGDGKVVLQSQHRSQLQQWLEEAQPLILIDVQRGLAVHARKVSEEILISNDTIKKGWINYPLPMKLSVATHENENLCMDMTQYSDGLFQNKSTCKTDRLEEAVHNFGLQVQDMRTKAECQGDDLSCLSEKLLAETELEKMENLYSQAQKIMRGEEHDKKSLSSLFSRRFLEALVDQDVVGELANAYSIRSMNDELIEKRWLIQESIVPLIKNGVISNFVLKNRDAFQIALTGLSYSDEKIAKLWLQLIDAQAGHEDKLTILKQLTFHLNELDILGTWLNTREFPLNWVQSKIDFLFGRWFDTHLTWSHVERTRDYLEKGKIYFDTVHKKIRDLRSFNLSRWENPNDYEKNRKEYDEEFTSYFTSDAFLKHPNALAEYVKLEAMDEFLFLFDMTGKTLRGSAKLYSSVEQLVMNFKQLVTSYLNILEAWVKLTPEIEFPQLRFQDDRVSLITSTSASDYVKDIKILFEKNLKQDANESQLYPSSHFNVSEAALGSQMLAYVPEVSEDFFTLSHQSCNAIIGKIIKDKINPNNELPHTFKNLSKELKEIDKRVEFGSTNFTPQEVQSSFHIPLGQAHQALLKLAYLRKTKSYKLTLIYRGGAIGWKVDELNLTSLLWSVYHDIPLSLTMRRLNNSFQLEMEDPEHVSKEYLKDLVVSMNAVTFSHHTPLPLSYLESVPLAVQIREEVSNGMDQRSFEIAEKLAKKAVSSESQDDLKFGLNLYLALAKQGHAVDGARDAAKRISKSSELQNLSDKILRVLSQQVSHPKN